MVPLLVVWEEEASDAAVDWIRIRFASRERNVQALTSSHVSDRQTRDARGQIPRDCLDRSGVAATPVVMGAAHGRQARASCD